MAIPFHQAAQKLKMHPFNTLIAIYEKSMPISDWWPQVANEGLVETLEQLLNPHQDVHAKPKTAQEVNPAPAQMISAERGLELTEDAIKVLDKLLRQGLWESRRVHYDRYRKLICPKTFSQEKADLVLEELTEKGLVIGGVKSPISLNSDKKIMIEELVQKYRFK